MKGYGALVSLLALGVEGKYGSCRGVAFTVSATAQNRNLTGIDAALEDLATLKKVLEEDKFPRVEVSGTESIAGWYCEPNFQREKNAGTLQVLLGSITTNREMWTAQGGTDLYSPPLKPYREEMYSWVEYANRLGYATLALDHLGQGKSSHPDPVAMVQDAYEIELYHNLVEQIKSGHSPLPKAYKSLYFVGNSYGSVIGNQVTQKHPHDFSKIILTGFSKSVLPSLPGVYAQNATLAAMVDPTKFGSLPQGYLTSPKEETRTSSFFGSHEYVDFEQRVADLYFERKDVVSVGQFVSTYIDIVAAPEYRGEVLVLTGEHDQAFCGPGSSAIDPAPRCGGLLKETGELFPNAEYNWFEVKRTGHALVLHETVGESLRVAHEFFQGRRFGGY